MLLEYLFYFIFFIAPITISFVYIFYTKTKSPTNIIIGTFIVGVPFGIGSFILLYFGLDKILELIV